MDQPGKSDERGLYKFTVFKVPSSRNLVKSNKPLKSTAYVDILASPMWGERLKFGGLDDG
jgi:hypothetical protein